MDLPFGRIHILVKSMLMLIPFCVGAGLSIDFLKFLNMVGEWEGAGEENIFERHDEYAVWRYDLLTLLQQLRIFNNLLTDSALTLLILRGLGSVTGMSAVLRVVRNIDRPSEAVGNGEAARRWDIEEATNEARSTAVQIKQMAYTLFEKSLPGGIIMDMLEAIGADGNVLNLIHSLDSIYFPMAPGDVDLARSAYYSNVCQHGEHPATFAARLQKLRTNCKRLGYEVSLSDFLVRVRTGLENVYVLLGATFNHLESPDQPAHKHCDSITMPKYVLWLSLVVKEFTKMYPAAGSGASMSVKPRHDSDKPSKFGDVAGTTRRTAVSFQSERTDRKLGQHSTTISTVGQR